MKALSDITLDYHTASRQSELLGFFNELREHASDWEGKELLKSNERLYSILQKCYATAVEMSGTEPSHEKMKESFREYCKGRQYKFQDTTPLVQRIVRVVFAEPDEKSWNRSRISIYGKALLILQENNVDPEDVTETIKAAGGIEEVKRKGDIEKAVDQSERGRKILTQQSVIDTVSSRKLTLKLDRNKPSSVVLLVATRVNDEFEIREVVQKDALVNSVMKEIGKRNADLDVDVDAEEPTQKGTVTIPMTAEEAARLNVAKLTASANKVPEPA